MITLLVALLGTLATPGLSDKDRAALADTVDSLYDTDYAGWGTGHKQIDVAAIEWSFASLDAGNQLAMTRIRRTLDANRNLLDPVGGGVFQYSEEADWKSPHHAKPLSSQADDLRVYSEAYARWHRKTDLEAAQKIYGYLTSSLSAPDGGFFASQSTDVSPPGTDTHEYSRETGWAIRALCKYFDVTGDATALSRAQSAAKWAHDSRQLPGGGFAHEARTGSPLLEDNVSLAEAFIVLYRSTGNRDWLKSAVTTLEFIDSKLRDPRAGYVGDVAQNAAVVRAANTIYRYTASNRHLQIARHAMTSLAGMAATANQPFLADILLADHELSAAPIHITVVGHKDDPAARSLHAAALQYPTDYLQVDWWDKREGRLPDPTITYPELKRAAAFACTANACSTPVYEPEEIQETVRSVLGTY